MHATARRIYRQVFAGLIPPAVAADWVEQHHEADPEFFARIWRVLVRNCGVREQARLAVCEFGSELRMRGYGYVRESEIVE